MICAKCGGSLEVKNIELDRRLQGHLVIFVNVPSKVCTQCGEVWLSSKIVREMDIAINEKRRIVRVESVPVFSLKEMQASN
ncbi:hypothetical protein HX99_06220 [Peptococcaceae bacterium SCADC1_2_3]|jgi:YgiT-type zinc finger domain-containing protein|nr:hypothetical protein HX99_06220 [Peptococcaceae bacterium SCADC1_2_3]